MRKTVIFIALVCLAVLCATSAYATNGGPPSLPHAFYGSVTVNGVPAADGTQVSATVDSGTILATQNPVTTVGGSYGVNSLRLLVQGDIPNGATITFYVDGIKVEGVTATFEAGGGPTEKNLSVTRPAPVGGGGAGAPDTTPPEIFDISVSNISKTSADIGWRTNEMSDSQVEYWSSPSKFSPLDTKMTIYHAVSLTDLTPGSTYYFKVMSKDAPGNLAVSDQHAFTTLAGAATFISSKLSISPSEVYIGETVTISVVINNTGDGAGSYGVTLKLNGALEATKAVTLNAGASEEITFSIVKDIAGSYSVEVNGLSGSFTVKEKPAPAPTPPPPPPAPPVKPPINWPVIGGIIAAAVIVVGLLIFFLVRRRAT